MITAEILNSKNFYQDQYKLVGVEITNTIAHFELIITIPTILTNFLFSFRTDVAFYSCMKLPHNTNYLFLYLDKMYVVAHQRLIRSTGAAPAHSTEKLRLVQKLFRNSF